MRICSIASGSSGNCTYIGSENTHILIDAGSSGKKIEEGLNELGLTGQDIDAIFITHEHIDHIGALGVFARKYGTNIFATDGTLLGTIRRIGDVKNLNLNAIRCKMEYEIGDLKVKGIKIPHDTLEPCAYTVEHSGKKMGVLTDLGMYNDEIIEAYKGISAMVIESNHDERLLRSGPYPLYLQNRILSGKGHLSNTDCNKLLREIVTQDTEYIFLGHLSEENNRPELALSANKMDIPIEVAPRYELSSCIEV